MSSPASPRSTSSAIDSRPLVVWTLASAGKQGLDALIRPEFGHVCRWLIVVSVLQPRSAPRMKLPGPEAVPPFASGSIDPRIFDRLIPEPDPPRKIIPSLVFHSRIDSMLSSTLRMKHAEHCGLSSNPTLNHTGELNAAIW